MSADDVESKPSDHAADESTSPSVVAASNPALSDKEDAPQPQAPVTPTRNNVGGAAGYNSLKSFNGQVYTGMAVGGSHTWNYDQGIWKETKVEPDLWKIDFETTKRRAKNAPAGSGAPVGIEYHWLVVAHQYVKKVDANTYETHLVGSKYKLAHKGPNAASWSIPTVKAQREQELQLLEDAKRRVEGLPPVTTSEKVKISRPEKGQQKLDSLFAKSPGSPLEKRVGMKRQRDERESLSPVAPQADKKRRVLDEKENLSPNT